MNLYLIQRSSGHFVEDAFAYAVVAAETGKAARRIHPAKGVIWEGASWIKQGRDYGFAVWADPKDLRSRLIGTASVGTPAGMVCASFN